MSAIRIGRLLALLAASGIVLSGCPFGPKEMDSFEFACKQQSDCVADAGEICVAESDGAMGVCKHWCTRQEDCAGDAGLSCVAELDGGRGVCGTAATVGTDAH